jgi:hypothetical protein
MGMFIVPIVAMSNFSQLLGAPNNEGRVLIPPTYGARLVPGV